MEMAVKSVKGAARGAGRRRRRRWRGKLLPRRWQHGGTPPLSPLPSWLLGSPPPWRWDPWGRQKRGFDGWKFVVGAVSYDLGFPSLYRLSDFRQPLLGSTKTGISGASGLGLGRIFSPDLLK